LRALKLIDDAAYARYFAEARDRTSPRGRRLITQELRANGVDVDTAATATADLSDEEAAYRLASRRMRSLSGIEYDAFRSRLGGMLQRRGFGWDTARATIERCWTELGRERAEDDLVSTIE
jgi:regulatory protein